VWHHAHEWFRANLRVVVDLYKSRSNINIDEYLGGLPQCCFDEPEHVVEEGPSWEQHVPNLGDMVHAFPKIVMTRTSWARTLTEKQYVVFVSDGDLNMLTDMRKGMGGGRMAQNRSGIDTPISGCGFHKYKSIKGMCDKALNLARTALRNGSTEYTKFGRVVLHGKKDFDQLFGALFDECIQHDDPKVGLMAWSLMIMKMEWMGMKTFALHLIKFHHPVTGRQGAWGRWNNVQEVALADVDEDDIVGTNTKVVYGSSSTSNPCEARVNKLMKLATGTSMSYGCLCTKAQRMCTSLSRDLTEVVHSVIGDQQGECKKTGHRKQSGALHAQKTGSL
jgi:hypothetical protein